MATIALPGGSLLAAPVRPLKAAGRPVFSWPRSQAPVALEVLLKSSFSKPVTGRFRLSVYRGRRLVHEYESGPMVVVPDLQRFHVMLPPVVVWNDKTPITGYARLVTDRETIDLGEIDIVVAPNWKRSLVVVFALPEEHSRPGDAKRRAGGDVAAVPATLDEARAAVAMSAESASLAQALALETFNPDPTLRPDLVTHPAPLAPAEFPATALAYAGADVVVLEGDGFEQLNGSQLSAIADWVEGGGSVCVQPQGPVSVTHAGFLNRLAEAKADDPAYERDSGGEIVPRRPSTELLTMHRPGLGRAVVLHRRLDPETALESVQWQRAMWFLWKMRVDQTAAVSGRGVWEWQSQPMTYFDHPSQRPLAPEHELVASQLRELLLPEKVEGVPFAVVAAILVVFLLVIAPGDYVLLGAMGLRRYTWVFLAAMSLAFTWVTVKIADRTMGSGDYHRGLVFVDLIAGGRAARTSRFEMLFTATQRTVETTFDDALYVPLVERRDPASRRSGRTLPQLAEDEESAASPRTVADLPVYSGRVPAAYTIRQQMRQWSPVVSRETRFGGDIAAPAIGWDDFDPSAWTTLEGRKELAAIIGAAEPGARVYLFHLGQFFDLQHMLTFDLGPGLFSATAPYSNLPNSFVELIFRASVRTKTRYFSIVSQVSPSGADSFEDLAVIDTSAPGEWLLIVAVERGNDRVVFRRLYAGGG